MAKFLKFAITSILGALGFVILITQFKNTKTFGNALDKILKEDFQVASHIKEVLKETFDLSNIHLKGEEENLIKIMFLGIPGEPNPAPKMTDSIIIVFIKKTPENYNSKIVSIPRDLIVYNNLLKDYVKINSFYSLYGRSGIDLLKEKIATITGYTMDYFVLIDLSVVKEIVDYVGGINLWVEETIDDPNFPLDESRTIHFTLPRGWRYVDGDTALKFIRTRHSKEGDFGRIKRQQALILAIYNKMRHKDLLNLKTFNHLLAKIGPKILTDINIFEAIKFYSIFKTLNYENINKTFLNLNNVLTEGKKNIYGGQQFVLFPQQGLDNFTPIHNLVKDFINN